MPRYHRKRRQWIGFFSIIVGFISLLVILYARMVQVRNRALESASEEGLPAVRAMPAQATDTWRLVGFLARVEGGQTVQIRATVSGWVVDRPVVRGQAVKKGDVLLRLKDERKQLALQEAEARLRAAEAALRDLERRLKTTRSLVEEGIIAEDTLDTLLHQVDAQRASVQALQATVQRMHWDVDHLTVRAPITGRVVEIIPDIGQEVMPGEPVASMVNTETRRVIAGVDSRWLRHIRPGMKVELRSTTNNGPAASGRARIVGISPDMDTRSGTYKVEAEMLPPFPDWLPGEVVQMLVPIERLENVVLVPRNAVLSDDTGYFIFVYKDGRALQVPVTVTWVSDTMGAVPVQLLPSGAQIIYEGHVGLADGQPVRLLEETSHPE